MLEEAFRRNLAPGGVNSDERVSLRLLYGIQDLGIRVK